MRSALMLIYPIQTKGSVIFDTHERNLLQGGMTYVLILEVI